MRSKQNKTLHAWNAKVGTKGQIVIPKEAREIFSIQPGDNVLILGDEKKGLAILNGETASTIFTNIMEDLESE
ncbi:AbrB/MazE/SpoVT family DNA-binding domain-containing protein [Facklamia sp. DSM 111018]|uniref:AbrB/MazE/SpoVT family DNA-binding domain-containing protein n=1 Tax=Facklamia lactis TaxID=2749967 RepID=A0ABS0LSE6_9LACT|nr:AbrB/MazE/SpoVT family DNA-binding domain-containing protein [Facklamia lactis]MBG9980376.1 AbrB/MazE/SpoVT family DNA-binding domain-containing protein [Facklamia lactis]MBG9986179.1 AbrB/MazE/SpoVT family DNA-binding domain-containing protein [Facklamia lactis]